MAHQSPRKRVLLQVDDEASRANRGLTTTHAVHWIFPGESLRVGRAADQVDVAFETDSAMSKRHFELHFDGETCRLVDLGSANGTRVNGKPVADQVLKDGDEICAGRTMLRACILGVGGETASEDSQADAQQPPPGDLAQPEQREPLLPPAPPPKVVTLRLADESAAKDSEGQLTRLIAWIRAGQRIVVGSSGFAADWRVPAELGVAPAHFQVALDDEGCSILDMGATIRVNGRAVSKLHLRDGDKIVAGEATFIVQFS